MGKPVAATAEHPMGENPVLDLVVAATIVEPQVTRRRNAGSRPAEDKIEDGRLRRDHLQGPDLDPLRLGRAGTAGRRDTEQRIADFRPAAKVNPGMQARRGRMAKVARGSTRAKKVGGRG